MCIFASENFIEKVMKKFFLFMILGGLSAIGYGQQPLEIKGDIQQESLHVNMDSIALLSLQKNKSTVDSSRIQPSIQYQILPDYSSFTANPLFMDLIFTGLNVNFNPPPAPVVAQMEKDYTYYGKDVKAYFSPQFFTGNYLDSLRAWQKEQLIIDDPTRISTDIWRLPNPESITIHHIPLPGRRDLVLKNKINTTKSPQKMGVANVEKDPWSTKGGVSMLFSQNYTSPNWYQGGRSNLAALFDLEASANYDDQKKWQFDNSISVKMGIQSESADTLHHYSVTENQILLNSKLGLKAYENWYYSLSGTFTTYSLTSYSALNSTTKVNGFFSPYRIDIGLGMDYKYKKELSVLLTPVSFKDVYFADTAHYNIKNFGLDAGTRSLQEIGSSVKATYTKRLSSDLDVSSQFSFYTNYKKAIEVDWETTFNIALNRFFSMKTTIHPRYDSSVIEAGDQRAKIQFKELMSFGFAYKFNNIRAKNSRFH
jgi:hypothetical protein